MPVTHNKAIVTIPAAQVLTLNTAPVQLVAGSPTFLVNLYSLYIRYHHGSVPFNPGIHDFIVAYTGDGTAAGSLLTYPGTTVHGVGFVDQTQDMSLYLDAWFAQNGSVGIGGTSAAPVSKIVGAGLFLTQFTSVDESYTQFPTGTNWTLGNGSLIVTIEYSYLLA